MSKNKTPSSVGQKTFDAKTGCIDVSGKALVFEALRNLREATTVSDVVVAGSKVKGLIKKYRSSAKKCA